LEGSKPCAGISFAVDHKKAMGEKVLY
jgi:hypothetical protein